MKEPGDNNEENDSNLLTEDRPVRVEKVAPAPLGRLSHAEPDRPVVRRRDEKDEKDFKYEEEDESFFERHRLWLIAGTIVVLGAGWIIYQKPWAGSAPVHKAPEAQIVRIQLPPPPPPPPPPKIQPPPPKDDKRIEETPVAKPEPKPEAPKPKPEQPPEGLGTNVKGNGPGMAGLGSSGNGMIGGTGTGSGGGGSMAKWYAGQLGTKIAETLRNHRKTRNANIRVDAHIWVDATGRITRATLDNSTGDNSIDAALTNEILPGVQATEPPPKGMRMPIPYRFTARRPN